VTVVLSDFEHKDVLWVKLTDAVWEYIKTWHHKKKHKVETQFQDKNLISVSQEF
jgi:hypothetical protein